MSEQDYWERVLKGIILRLHNQNNSQLASHLIDCDIIGTWCNQDFNVDYYQVSIIAEPKDFDFLLPQEKDLHEIIKHILRGDPSPTRCSSLTISLALPEIEEGWRDTLRTVLSGENILNQGVLTSKAPLEYKGLYFRSKTEIKIAEALNRLNILYFPLPVACYKGRNREPDFLICTQTGKWGILEVQGEPYHPASRADQDHDRARAFMHFGIPVQFYPSEKCYNNPDWVIQDFLKVISAMQK